MKSEVAGPSLLESLNLARKYSPMEMFKHFSDKYGEVVHLLLGFTHVYIFTNPDHIHEILVTQADKFSRTKISHKVAGPLVGDGLVLSHGEFHKRQRKLMQPALHAKRIESYHQLMVERTAQMLDGWKDGDSREIMDDISQLTLNIVAKTLFGADIQKFVEIVRPAIDTATQILAAQLNSVLPSWLYVDRTRRLNEAVKVIDSVVGEIIDTRRASNEDTGDLLSMLILTDEEEERMTDKQVRDEIITLFISGHETAAAGLTWMFYLIARHPEIEARIREELAAVLNGEPPTLQAKLPYLDMVIKEAMRIYPPVWIFNREALEDIVIGGYKLKKGANIFISPYITQNSPSYFPEPAKFDPERFAPEKEIARYTYFPFGGGPHACIGNAFAMMETRVILAMTLQRYRLELLTGEVQPKATTILQPSSKVLMRVTSSHP